MVKHTQTIRWLLLMICLSVFNHFVELALKGLKIGTLFFSMINYVLYEKKQQVFLKLNSNVEVSDLSNYYKLKQFSRINLSKNNQDSCFQTSHLWRANNLFKRMCNIRTSELFISAGWYQIAVLSKIISSNSACLNRKVNMVVMLEGKLGVVAFGLLLSITGVFPYFYLFIFFF